MAAISNFWQRIITGSVFLLVMMGSILWSYPSLLILFGIITALAIHEYARIATTLTPLGKWTLIITTTLSYFALALRSYAARMEENSIVPVHAYKVYFLAFLVLAIILGALIFFIAELFRKTDKPFQNISFSITGFIYVLLPFSLITEIPYPAKTFTQEYLLVFFLFIWINDSFAYIWGKLLGRHKLAPHISAGKTIEGTVGGILTTVAISYAFMFVFARIHLSLWQWMGFGLITALFGIAGDLVESLLKRQAGIKDSGNILPGHGGILDRFDSAMLAAPAIYVYLLLISAI